MVRKTAESCKIHECSTDPQCVIHHGVPGDPAADTENKNTIDVPESVGAELPAELLERLSDLLPVLTNVTVEARRRGTWAALRQRFKYKPPNEDTTPEEVARELVAIALKDAEGPRGEAEQYRVRMLLSDTSKRYCVFTPKVAADGRLEMVDHNPEPVDQIGRASEIAVNCMEAVWKTAEAGARVAEGLEKQAGALQTVLTSVTNMVSDRNQLMADVADRALERDQIRQEYELEKMRLEKGYGLLDRVAEPIGRQFASMIVDDGPLPGRLTKLLASLDKATLGKLKELLTERELEYVERATKTKDDAEFCNVFTAFDAEVAKRGTEGQSQFLRDLSATLPEAAAKEMADIWQKVGELTNSGG